MSILQAILLQTKLIRQRNDDQEKSKRKFMLHYSNCVVVIIKLLILEINILYI